MVRCATFHLVLTLRQDVLHPSMVVSDEEEALSGQLLSVREAGILPGPLVRLPRG